MNLREEPASVKLRHSSPVAQTTSACDTIGLSDVNVPHADLQNRASTVGLGAGDETERAPEERQREGLSLSVLLGVALQ